METEKQKKVRKAIHLLTKKGAKAIEYGGKIHIVPNEIENKKEFRIKNINVKEIILSLRDEPIIVTENGQERLQFEKIQKIEIL